MARVELLQESEHPELAEVVGKLAGGRRGRLLNLYRMLLHNPDIAQTWFEHVGAVRWKTGLDGKLREIVIIRIGLVNQVAYVVKAHVPGYALEEGLTLEQCDALANWVPSQLFDARERAALAYTDAMTRSVQVPDSVFTEVRKHFTERQIVELTVLIGTYNMHTRVLQALEVEPDVR